MKPSFEENYQSELLINRQLHKFGLLFILPKFGSQGFAEFGKPELTRKSMNRRESHRAPRSEPPEEKPYNIIIGLAVVAIGLVLALIYGLSDDSAKEEPPPKFSIVGGDTLSSEKKFISFEPLNKNASLERNLDLKIGNETLFGIIQLEKTESEISWRLSLDAIEDSIILDKLSKGENNIEIGFANTSQWETHSFFINDLIRFLPIPNKDPVGKSASDPDEDCPSGFFEGKSFYEVTKCCLIKKAVSRPQAKLAAASCARDYATAELVQLIHGIRIDGGSNNNDGQRNGDSVQGQTSGSIKGVYQWGKITYTDHYAIAKMRLNK